MEELWKPIKNYECLYEVSNYGRVRSLAREEREQDKINGLLRNKKRWRKEKILKTRLDNNGYLQVVLSKQNKIKCYKVHLLVWDTFGNNKRNGKTLKVDHVDDNKANPVITNLQLLTAKENTNKYHNKRRVSLCQ